MNIESEFWQNWIFMHNTITIFMILTVISKLDNHRS